MSDLHIASQTTNKYGIPLNHLEYSYVEKCSDIKELEKILRVLRSGDEGRFPDLEAFVEKRLESLSPKSRMLRKDNPISKLGELGSGDWQAIQQDLKEWSNDMHNKDHAKPSKVVKASGEDLYEGDENLPPVRSTNVVLEGNKRKEVKADKSSKKRVMPRDYKEWDKVDIDAELEKVEDVAEKKKTPHRTSVEGITDKIDSKGMSVEEKERKANREKDKGNEAYRSGDFEESVTYYSRSISLLPTSASYNNRALAYLKMEKWDKAIKDCNIVLNMEKENVKALLRRGTAYKSKNQLSKGKTDFEKVLELEPNNKKAESLLIDVNKLLNEEAKSRKEKGRRMVIEEVESDEEEVEIEIEKPIVNGFGRHNGVKENGIHEIVEDDTKQDLEAEKGGHEKKLKESEHLNSKQESSSTCHTSASKKDTKEMCSQQQLKNISGTNTASPNTQHTPVDKLHKKGNNPSSALDKGDKKTEATKSSNKEAVANALLADKSSSQLSSSSSLSSPSTASDIIPPADQTLITESKCEATSVTSSSSSPSSTTAAENSSPSTPGGVISSEASSHSFNRPVYVQLPLSTQVSKLKGEGNNLFRSGQYDSALRYYTQAITLLEKEKDQTVNISLLLSNRAACQLKIGNSSEAVKDCGRSLELVPHSLKSLLRRAAAYESVEVYAKAYVDYKHVLSIDRSVDQALQGASRCQRMLQDIHGQAVWRDKIPALTHVQPWEIPVIVDEASAKDMASTVPVTAQTAKSGQDKQSAQPTPVPHSEKEASLRSAKKETPQSKVKTPVNENKAVPEKKETPQAVPEKKETPQPSKQEQFERLKASGNLHVQKGQYLEAEKCYTSCIGLCPEQVACYTNRALCYIKLNKPTEAEADCDKALTLQSDNPKALYRRALARKNLQRYKLSMQDLIELLKLEPKNKAASSEMETVKKFYKEELEQLKMKKQEADKKVRKRMKIEEVDDDEEEEKSGRSKTQGKSQSKLRGAKSNQTPSTVKSKGNSQTAADKKQSTNKEPLSSSLSSLSSSSSSHSNHSAPVAPPSTPRMLKTTPYEFCQAWNSLKPTQGIQPYAEILRQISPPDLPSVISNKLDGQMLQIIVRCVHEEMVLKGEVDKGYQILDNLCKVPRFSTVSMFLSSKEKKEVSSVLDILGETSSSTYSKMDVSRLKKEYSVR